MGERFSPPQAFIHKQEQLGGCCCCTGYAYASGMALNSLAIALAGFRPLGHVFVQLMIWWHRYSWDKGHANQRTRHSRQTPHKWKTKHSVVNVSRYTDGEAGHRVGARGKPPTGRPQT